MNSVTIQPIKENAYKPKIKNAINKNAYGILLHTRKSIEEFQKNSGMQGDYTKEYQHHYWSINARLAVDGQVLDISIPLVMFNYEQTVTGGDIKFDLVEVEKVSNTLEKVVKAKFNEFKKTKIYEYINEVIGATTWTFVPLNTANVHPGGKHQAFSGIDLRQDATYPGVVYPLTKGIAIPSFSCIMAHIEKKAEIVHSEYRLFSEAKNGDKVYAHGRCATLVRGYIPEPLPPMKQPDKVPQRIIDKIFNIMPEQPKKIEEPKQKKTPSYGLLNQMGMKDGEEFLKEIFEVWNEVDFEPDVSMVKKENIKTPVIQAFSPPGRVNHGISQQQFWNDDEKSHSTHRNSKKQENNVGKNDGADVTMFDLKKAIVDEGLATWNELLPATYKDVQDMYNMIQLLKDEQEYGCSYSKEELTKIRFLLNEEEYLPIAKINNMSDEEVAAFYDNFYEKNGEKNEV